MSTTIARRLGGRTVNVPVAPFQARALELVAQGFSWNEIAQWCGYQRGETSRIKRAVGLQAEVVNGGGAYHPRKSLISYELACRLARGLDIDPTDCGI